MNQLQAYLEKLSKVLESISKTSLVFLVSIVASSKWVHADPPFMELPPQSVCPSGSVQQVMAPDGSSVSVLFDRFQVDVGLGERRERARGFCEIAIPITVPEGYQMGVYKVDYRGFTSLPLEAKSVLWVDYQVNDFSPPSFRRPVGMAGQAAEFSVTDKINPQQMRWSGCGGAVNLKASISLFVQSNRSGQQAFATLDSIDGAGLVYGLQFKPCRVRGRALFR